MPQLFALCSPEWTPRDFNTELKDQLFNGEAEYVVETIAVPVVPADVHPIANSGQLATAPKSKSAETKFIAESHEVKLSNKQLSLGPNKRDREMDADDLDEQHPKRPKQESLLVKSTISILTLPTEIHCLVFEFLNTEEAFLLAVTSPYFWSIGRRHLLRYYASCMGPYAGNKLINLGSSLEIKDQPQGLIPETWIESLQKSLKEGDESPLGPEPIDLFDQAISRSQSILPFDSNSITTQLTALKHKHQIRTQPYPGIFHVLQPCPHDYYPQDRIWILRNLTTAEYVRAEQPSLIPICGRANTFSATINRMGFGAVVAMRCTWTSTMAGTGIPATRIQQGKWAGHRLDVTVLETLTQGGATLMAKWKDVSDEVAAEIDELRSLVVV